ncbi:MAG: peptide ABC transporter substrate-binding protein [Bacillota bacterium]
MKIKNIWLVSLLLLALFVSGCGKSDLPLRIGINNEPETLDPRKLSGRYEALVAKQLFECLTYMDATGEVKPAAAERWETLNDGTKYVFHLRKDAKWSDGSAVTANDFAYAWRTHLDPKFASVTADGLYFIKNAERYNSGKCPLADVGIKTPDDYTIEVELEQPTPFFPDLLTSYYYAPVCQRVLERDPTTFSDVKKIVCNGAFKLKNWSHNSKIEVVKNENYWNAEVVKLQQAEFVITENSSTLLAMLEGNQLDILFSPPLAEIPRLTAENKLKILPLLGTYFYSFNNQQAPFNDARVRQAFCLALNRKALVEQVLKGGQQPAMALVSPGIADYQEGSDFRTVGGDYFRDNDVATARTLLAEAGYPGGKGFPDVAVLYNTADEHKQMAEAVQEMWRNNLGVNIRLTNMEWKVFLATRRKYDYAITRDGWTADYADPYTFLSLFCEQLGTPKANYRDKIFDAVLLGSNKVDNKRMRSKLLHEAENTLMQSFAIIPIYYYTDTLCIAPRVKNFNHNALGDVFLKTIEIE